MPSDDFKDWAGPWTGEGGTEVDAEFVEVKGDTMTGYLTLHDNPVNQNHACTKQYADSIVGGPWATQDHDHAGIYEPADGSIQTHIVDSTLHFIINDASTATDVAWSGNKLDTEFAGKAPISHTHSETDITDLDKYTKGEVDAKVSNIVLGANAGWGFEDVPENLGPDEARTPYGWALVGSSDISVLTNNLGYSHEKVAPNSVGHFSYGTPSHLGLNGGLVGWWSVTKRFHAQYDNLPLSIEAWAWTSINLSGWDTIHTPGEESFMGEDDGYIEVHFFDDAETEIAATLAENHSVSAGHQYWLDTGQLDNLGNIWLPMYLNVTTPVGTKYFEISLVATDASNATRALGDKAQNAAVFFDDLSIDYDGGFTEISFQTDFTRL